MQKQKVFPVITKSSFLLNVWRQEAARAPERRQTRNVWKKLHHEASMMIRAKKTSVWAQITLFYWHIVIFFPSFLIPNPLLRSGQYPGSWLAELSCPSPGGVCGLALTARTGKLPKQTRPWRQQSGAESPLQQDVTSGCDITGRGRWLQSFSPTHTQSSVFSLFYININI